jgi:predicted O-linked N-acetylglucosamine transferase (SPINDLY family)
MATLSTALATALAHHRAGRLDLAEEIYRRILAADPAQAEARHFLGVVFHQRGQHQAAVEQIGRAIGIDGHQAAFHNNLGEAYRALGERAQAAACFRRAIELSPDYALAHYNLGSLLHEQGKIDQAVAAYRRAIAVNPNLAKAHYNLGLALQALGNRDTAVASYRQAIACKADFLDAYHNLGAICQRRGEIDAAMFCYRRAVELRPDDAGAHNNLGAVHYEQGNVDAALACYRRALELRPDWSGAHSNLATVWKDRGLLDEALAAYRQAVDVNPADARSHSNLLSALHYRSGITLAELAVAHAEYERRHAAPLYAKQMPLTIDRDPERPLRLGFVSADLGRHPVGVFLIRALENLDRRQYSIVCYSDRDVFDPITARFQAVSATWRDTSGVPDARLAQQVRDDRIDILLGLAGHTARNRLLMFARRPAPVQISWLGYVGTTGLEAVDYVLADRHEVPAGAERHYRERVLRLPDSYVCYDPPAEAPPVGPLPALSAGRITLASFNNPSKITPQVVHTWSRILKRLPQSRLLLKYRRLNHTATQSRFRELFAAEGIAADRVELAGWSPQAGLLACYNRVDLALDTFPYNGGLTTCEALWMGVPVVTCPGETFAGRHSLSHLSTVGLTETIAHDLDAYVELAVALAADLPRLAALRAGLRQRVARSPLCDGPRFAANLAQLLRQAWREKVKDEG